MTAPPDRAIAEKAPVVPEPPTRTIAMASALAVGAALAAGILRPAPVRSVLATGSSPAPPEEDPAEAVSAEARALLAVVLGFRSEDPAVRRETAGVVERLVRDPDPRRRLVLAASLRMLGGREAVLPLCLLVGDENPAVRIVARRALHAEARQPGARRPDTRNGEAKR
jgi:HEAT repeat protein